jgi:putative Ca2+/H+ antiporter (TMEM165/GDT1 family)
MLASQDQHSPFGAATRVHEATVARTGFWWVASASFVVLFMAEFGDLTQIATANLAAKYHDPLAVGVGAVLGLWAVGALAITGGQQLLRLIPFTWIVRIAAAIMTILAVVSLFNAIAG